MFPDLTGLSQEEAALITDVLSRLSLGSTPTSSLGLQAQPARGVLQDPALLELDLAAWTIEQELKGIQVSPASAALSGRPVVGHPIYPYSPSHSVNAGARHTSVPVGAYSSPSAGLPGVGASSGYGTRAAAQAMQEPFAELLLQPEGLASRPHPLSSTPAQAQQPGPFVASPLAYFQPDTQGAGSSPEYGEQLQMQRAPADEPRRTQQAQAARGTDSPASPAPAQTMSLLQEMRERLRQQQNQQVAAQTSIDVDAGAGSSVNGSIASLEGLHTPVALKATATGHVPYAHMASGSAAAPATSAPSTQSRRAPPSAPGSSSKAFTMLNARTSVERYGPDPGHGEADSSTPPKVPVKLPDHERSARLQQLYERTLRWRQRCDERYAKARHDRETSELDGCTFTPKITTASTLIMQGKSPSEVYQELSKGGTPTKHQRDLASQDRQQSPCSTTSKQQTTPSRGTARVEGSVRSPLLGNNAAASSRAPTSAGSKNLGGAAASPSPGRMAVNGTEVGTRLYQRAFQQRARQEERVFQQVVDEERQRQFTASVQGVSPRVYNPPEPSLSRYLPTGMEECTFHPRTRFRVISSRAFEDSESALRQRRDHLHQEQRRGSSRHPSHSSSSYHQGAWQDASPSAAASASLRSSFMGFTRRPKSAPHMRGSDGHPRSTSPTQRYDYNSVGVAAPDNVACQPQSHNGARRTSSVHTTVSISPDLDWDEFLARQERFLATREHKLQLLERSEPTIPRMSPGSKKLLREREMRQSPLHTEGAGEAGGMGLQGEASTLTAHSSPSWQDRRVRTIMEMYKECTFQPQITRRAAAMPSRNVEDFVEGGRARREEWMEQQRALQQVQEVEGVTFKPDTFTKDAYSHVRPRISMRNPDAYLAHVADKRRQREALRAELDGEREALELQHCTFKPQTTPLPGYLIRRLQEQHLQQLEAQQEEHATLWEEGNGGFTEMGAVGMGDGQGYDAYYADTLEEQPPELHSHVDMEDFGTSLAEEVDEMPVPELDSYQDAYQRALHYATAHPQDM